MVKTLFSECMNVLDTYTYSNKLNLKPVTRYSYKYISWHLKLIYNKILSYFILLSYSNENTLAITILSVDFRCWKQFLYFFPFHRT